LAVGPPGPRAIDVVRRRHAPAEHEVFGIFSSPPSSPDPASTNRGRPLKRACFFAGRGGPLVPARFPRRSILAHAGFWWSPGPVKAPPNPHPPGVPPPFRRTPLQGRLVLLGVAVHGENVEVRPRQSAFCRGRFGRPHQREFTCGAHRPRPRENPQNPSKRPLDSAFPAGGLPAGFQPPLTSLVFPLKGRNHLWTREHGALPASHWGPIGFRHNQKKFPRPPVHLQCPNWPSQKIEEHLARQNNRSASLTASPARLNLFFHFPLSALTPPFPPPSARPVGGSRSPGLLVVFFFGFV